MKSIYLIFQTLLLTFFLTGCEWENPFKPSKAELQLKEKELNAKIAQDEQKLQVQKELELAKINTALEKEKLQTKNQEKENKYQLEIQQKQNELALQRDLVLLAGIIIIVISIGLYIYFNNRRKDKLKAYEDNMEKYFKSKENEAKVKIANKIIDTIATGQLSESQENLLISNLDNKEPISAKALKNLPKDDIFEAEVIDEDTLSKKKKKKEKKTKKKKKTKKTEE